MKRFRATLRPRASSFAALRRAVSKKMEGNGRRGGNSGWTRQGLDMRLVVDSSVFVAAFRDLEPSSTECFRFLSSLEKGTHQAVVPATVIVEVVAAISRRTKDPVLGRRVGMRLLSFLDS
jgi:hypothetical protein